MQDDAEVQNLGSCGVFFSWDRLAGAAVAGVAVFGKIVL